MKMLYIWDIEKIIEKTLHEHNLEIPFEFNNQLKVPMSYNKSHHIIKFNYLEINGYIAKMKVKIKETVENFVKIILYHVLGYYLDFKKNKHDTRIIMYGEEEEKEQLLALIERNSWEFGRTLVPKNLVDSYDQVYEFDKMLLKSK